MMLAVNIKWISNGLPSKMEIPVPSWMRKRREIDDFVTGWLSQYGDQEGYQLTDRKGRIL